MMPLVQTTWYLLSNLRVGSVMIDLNPLVSVISDSAEQIMGWFPIFDSMNGIRGELQVFPPINSGACQSALIGRLEPLQKLFHGHSVFFSLAGLASRATSIWLAFILGDCHWIG